MALHIDILIKLFGIVHKNYNESLASLGKVFALMTADVI